MTGSNGNAPQVEYVGLVIRLDNEAALDEAIERAANPIGVLRREAAEYRAKGAAVVEVVVEVGGEHRMNMTFDELEERLRDGDPPHDS